MIFIGRKINVWSDCGKHEKCEQLAHENVCAAFWWRESVKWDGRQWCLCFYWLGISFFSLFFFSKHSNVWSSISTLWVLVVDFWCIGRGENCAVSLQPPHRAQLEFAINGVIMLGKVPWSDHSFNEKRNFHMHQYSSGISPSTQQSILPGPAAHQVPGLASCLNYSSAFSFQRSVRTRPCVWEVSFAEQMGS